MKENKKSFRQNESAIVNEYKGNLFEYFVAHEMSLAYHVEDIFLMHLNRDLKERLLNYEEKLVSIDRTLFEKLPLLAKMTMEKIYKHFPLEKGEVKDLQVVGKTINTLNRSLWSEADIVLITEKRPYLWSLKLSKTHSFTNTKSGGIKSFVIKYFSRFFLSESFQNELNGIVDASFYQMGADLYCRHHLYFDGHFGEEWSLHHPTLPGNLSQEESQIVFQHYERVAFALNQILRKLYEIDVEEFKKALWPLCGVGNTAIVQVTTFHQWHDFIATEICDPSNIQSKTELIKFLPFKQGAHSIQIILANLHLQIRIKPMNEFTTASYKVNCSVKVIKNEEK